MRSLRLLSLVVVATVALGLGRPAEGRAAGECRGLQVCLPVTGPWVAIPPSGGGAPAVAVWELRCPVRGYIVAGIDARVSDRSIDVSFRGENGAPVGPGVTTGREVLFTAVYAGTTVCKAPTYRMAASTSISGRGDQLERIWPQ